MPSVVRIKALVRRVKFKPPDFRIPQELLCLPDSLGGVSADHIQRRKDSRKGIGEFRCQAKDIFVRDRRGFFDRGRVPADEKTFRFLPDEKLGKPLIALGQILWISLKIGTGLRIDSARARMDMNIDS